MESDWKMFRAMLPVWRDRYLAGCNARIMGKLTDPKKTETERFWDAEEMVRKESKVLRDCLDDIRRSRMWDRLWAMRAAGMITREDLAGFSTELQDQIFPPPPEN
jgi:hypothetical protein